MSRESPQHKPLDPIPCMLQKLLDSFYAMGCRATRPLLPCGRCRTRTRNRGRQRHQARRASAYYKAPDWTQVARSIFGKWACFTPLLGKYVSDIHTFQITIVYQSLHPRVPVRYGPRQAYALHRLRRRFVHLLLAQTPRQQCAPRAMTRRWTYTSSPTPKSEPYKPSRACHFVC